MALRVRLTPRAILDLTEIRAYLVARSPRGADRVRREIDRTIRGLAKYPGIGHESHIDGVRVITTRRYPYLVYHRFSDQELTILHIRHGSRAPATRGDL